MDKNYKELKWWYAVTTMHAQNHKTDRMCSLLLIRQGWVLLSMATNLTAAAMTNHADVTEGPPQKEWLLVMLFGPLACMMQW